MITSGGGFSTVFARPGYQAYSVPAYFSRLSTQPAPGYNPGGRGYPDVALLGISYATVVAGVMQHLYGTSCAAPVFAGLGTCTAANTFVIFIDYISITSFISFCFLVFSVFGERGSSGAEHDIVGLPQPHPVCTGQ